MAQTRVKTFLLASGMICAFAALALAADAPFSGKWKGESKPAAAPAGGGAARGAAGAAAPGAPTATPGAAAAAPGAGAAAAAPAGGGGGGGRGGAGGGGGGGRGGGGGGGRGGFGGAGGGAQKVSLNLKQSKDNKLSGNIVFGEGDAADVKDGKVEGNTITFKAGRTPQPVYDYKGELKGDQLTLTRLSSDARGGRAQEFVLTKK